MALTINTNIASLNAQRRLGQSTTELRGSFERLSSGLRIVRARMMLRDLRLLIL
jgi:flagellin